MNELLQKAGRVCRLFGTAFSFTLFGIGGVVLGLIIFPTLFALERDPHERQVTARRWIGRSFALFIGLMKYLGVLSYEIVNRERLADHHNTLIIANHPSLIDVVFLIFFFPQAECVIKSAVTRNFFFRSAVSAANYISNESAVDLLVLGANRLKDGANLVLFPEATRTVPGQPLQFKLGAAAVALRSGASILPIAIRCSPTTLTKGEPWYHIPRTRPHWVLEVLPLIHPPALAKKAEDSRRQIRELNQQLTGIFEQALSARKPACSPAIGSREG